MEGSEENHETFGEVWRCSADNIACMMEAVCTYETSVYFNGTTGRYVPEGYKLHTRRCENLKSHIQRDRSAVRLEPSTFRIQVRCKPKPRGTRPMTGLRSHWLIRFVPWLRSLVARLSSRRPGFAPGSIHVEFVMDKVALGLVFLRVLRFSPVSIISPSLSKLISSEEYVIC
jgi:hypothetical protein